MPTAVAERVGFSVGEAKTLPRLHCVGKWSVNVEKAKVTQSGNYISVPFELSPVSGGIKGAYVNFLYRPEWLTAGFDPSSFDEIPNGSSMAFVHGKNMGRRGELGVIQAFAGSLEGLYELAGEMFALGEGTADAQKVARVFASYNEKYADRVIGYTLKQKSTKTDEVNPETGKAVYVKENGYEIDTFWIPTNDKHQQAEWRGTLKNKIQSAQRSGGATRVAFDESIPF